jgi:protein-L-isoaspartate(D-aspartate) O-methyltransferase
MDLALRRRFFAEEVEALARFTTPGLVDAFVDVPRERFLRPGPWVVASEASIGEGPRTTPDADPKHVYHNYVIGIEPSRQLFNGTPSLIGAAIDSLDLHHGARVAHVGAGLGYFSAIMGHVVGAGGRVLAIEVDEALATEASANVSGMPSVEVRQGDATTLGGETFDAILVNAGVTHPQPVWLDALSPRGRIVLPLTVTMGPMGPVGKGVMVRCARQPDGDFDARTTAFVGIYSGVGVRDDSLNAQLGQQFMRTPFPRLKRLRRDAHNAGPACFLHFDGWCFELQ